MISFLSFGLVLASAMLPTVVDAGKAPGEYEIVQPDSKASAMMMGLINQDKVENNRAKVDGGDTPVWGAIMSLNDSTVRGVQVNTNTFCASGGTLGNSSWAVFGGNQAAAYGGAEAASQTDQAGPYYDADGRRAIRLMEPADNDADLKWNDNPGGLQMQSARWYPGVEVLSDGSVVLIGGATGGGYINRNYPNLDPGYQGTPGQGSPTNIDGGANPTFETFPPTGPVQEMQFMITTSGLNMYPHTYLMPSGRMFVQANYSTILWDHKNNVEYKLPDMPDQVIRVYPASGAAAMLPLTPDNNYTPTILFCGGTAGLTDAQWGSYAGPGVNILDVAASTDCSSITPENADGSDASKVAYDQEEQLPVGRTMGQFIHLPDGTMVIVNGAAKGTAGYYNITFNYLADGTRTEGLAQEPTYTPVLYDPSKPKGSRLSSDGFSSSTIARLYHSSAILLPDGAVLVGGSNPHQDVALDMPTGTTPQAWNTTYELEKWYPPYYFRDRPGPQNMPDQIGYGGSTFNVTMDATYMGSTANFKANNTKFQVIRPGFSTHAMNMGQRSLQLSHTYTVNNDGTVDYMVNPMPINTNIFVPGPALLFCVIDGVPSIGKFVQLGDLFNKPVPAQVTVGKAPAVLPAPVNNPSFDDNPNESALQNFGIGKLVAIIAAAVVIILLIVVGLLCWRKRANRNGKPVGGGPVGMGAGAVGAGAGAWASRGDGNGEYKRVNTPASSLHNFAPGNPANQSTASLGTWDSYRMQDVGTPIGGAYDSPNSPRMGNGASLAVAGAGAGLAAGAAGASRTKSPLALKPAAVEDDNFGGGSTGGSVYNDSHQQYQDNSFGSQSNSGGGYDQSSYSNQQQQGWGEHQAGDAGEYYQDNTDRYQGHQAVDGSTGYAAGAYYDEPNANAADYSQQQGYGNDPYSNDQYEGYGSSGGGNYGSGGNYNFGGGGGGNYNSSGGGSGSYGASGGGYYSRSNGGGNYGGGSHGNSSNGGFAR